MMSASFDRPAAGATPSGKVSYRAGRLLGRIAVTAERIPPWTVLGAIMLVGWGVAVAAGRIAGHDGWLYYHGGDGTWYYTTAWVLGNGHIPAAVIGYGYPLLIAPIAGIAGSSLLDGIPAVVIFNQLVLAPIALVCIYGITRMFASRLYAYIVSLLWVLAPVVVIHYFLADYHSRYVDLTLPSAIGLTGLGDYPSMVVLLVSAYFLLRAIATAATLDAVAAGLAAGLALAVKPANALFLPAVLVALVVARKPRVLAIVALSLVPSLLGLAMWKYRGLGGLHVHQHVNFDWGQLHHNLDSIREYTWSQRMVYWFALAGIVGLARRSYVAAALAVTWFASYLLVKGTSPTVDFVTASFMTHLIAAFPAYFLLAVSVPFLVPIYGRRRPPSPVGPDTPLTAPKIAVSVLGFLAVVGFLAVALLPTLDSPAAAKQIHLNLYLPARPVHRRVPAVAGRRDALLGAAAALRHSCLVRDLPRPDRPRDLRAGQARRGQLRLLRDPRGRRGRRQHELDRPPAARHLGLPGRAERDARRPPESERLHRPQPAGHRHGAPVVTLR